MSLSVLRCVYGFHVGTLPQYICIYINVCVNKLFFKKYCRNVLSSWYVKFHSKKGEICHLAIGTMSVIGK